MPANVRRGLICLLLAISRFVIRGVLAVPGSIAALLTTRGTIGEMPAKPPSHATASVS